MAWQLASRYEVSVVAEDVNGHKVRTGFSMDVDPGLYTFEDVRARAQTIAEAMQGISGASLREVTVSHKLIEDDPVAATEQGEDKAFFAFTDDQFPANRVLINVPGCPSGILQPNLIDIDLDHADVQTFTDAIIESGALGEHVVSVAGGDVTAVERGYLSQRRSLTRPVRRAG